MAMIRRPGRLLAVLLLAGTALAVLAQLLTSDSGQEATLASSATPDPGAASRSEAPLRKDPVLLAPPAEPTAATAGSLAPGRTLAVHVTGRVVDASGGDPMPDVTVLVGLRDRAGQRLVSAADGGFELRETLELGPGETWRGALTLRALPPPGYLASPAQAIGEEGLFEAQPVVLRLLPGPSAVVRGIVRDVRSGQGIGDAVVTLRHAGSGLEEAVETDAGGGFTGALGFPAGRIRAEVGDLLNRTASGGELEAPTLGVVTLVHFEDGHRGGLHDLPVEVGPTLDLADALGGPLPSGSWRARIVSRFPEEPWAAVLQPSASGLERAPPQPLDESLVASFEARAKQLATAGFEVPERRRWTLPSARRTPPQEWSWREGREGVQRVRWPSQEHLPLPQLQPLLEFEATGWRGSAALDAAYGHQPGVVGIELTPVGSLSGAVLELGGRALPGVPVLLEPLTVESEDPQDGAWRTAVSSDTGAFGFANLPVGTWRLQVRPDDRAGFQEQVRVHQGGNPIDPVLLSPAGLGGAIEGRFDLPTGVRPPELQLVGREGSGFAAGVPVSVARGQPASFRRGTFSLEDVPYGDYDLIVRSAGWDPDVAWSPSTLRVRPPRRDLVLEVDRKFRKVQLEVVDVEGDPLPSASVWFGPDGPWMGGRNRPSRSFLVTANPDLRWTVSAWGYRPESGTAARFQSAGRHDVLPVTLRPGWGMTVLLRVLPADRAARRRRRTQEFAFRTDAPLEGVGVYLDGRHARRTDTRGRVDLESDAPPDHIQVRLPGWELSFVEMFERFQIPGRDLAVVWLEPSTRGAGVRER